MVQSTHLAPIYFCALISGISTRDIMPPKLVLGNFMKPRAAEGSPEPYSNSSLSQALASFTTDLYRESTRNIDAEENRVMSPLGLNILLGMVYLGTDGSTAAAMRDSMKLSSMNDSAIFSGYEDILESLNSQKSVQLIAANSMFVEKACPVKDSFLSGIRKTFRGDVEHLDFAKRKASAGTINSWVEGKTNSSIKRFVSPESLNSKTKLILINAIYFKGKWKKAFLPSSRTREYPFYTKSGKHNKLPFMESDETGYGYAKIPELDAEAALMPYEGDRFVMIALLPSYHSTLADMEKRIGQGFDLTTTLPAMIRASYTQIKVFFPKIKMESTINYIGTERILENLGLGDIISPSADLSKLTKKKNLTISNVFQKAVIEITEDGTEASAASGAGYSGMNRRKQNTPPILRFNRPFMGYVLDQQTKTILFMYRKTK